MTTKKNSASKYLSKKYGPLTVANFLRSWRLSEDLSQKDFANMLKMSAANLCDIERGRKGISVEKAVEIAKKIGYSKEALIKIVLQDQLAAAGIHLEVLLKTAG